MAPEQLSRKPVDRRADVYAIAVVLWELLAGRRILELGDVDDPLLALEVVRAHHPGPPSHFAPTLSKALDAVVMKGLVRDPAQRYETALEMATALEAALAPSSQREVGAWVTRVAGDLLRETLRDPPRDRESSAARSERQREDEPRAGDAVVARGVLDADRRRDGRGLATRRAAAAALRCAAVGVRRGGDRRCRRWRRLHVSNAARPGRHRAAAANARGIASHAAAGTRSRANAGAHADDHPDPDRYDARDDGAVE